MIAAIAVLFLITLSTRLLPLFFAKNLRGSRLIEQLGIWLPPAILLLLIAQMLVDSSPTSYPYAIPKLTGIGVAALLQLWRRQMLLSLGGSLASYLLIVKIMGGC